VRVAGGVGEAGGVGVSGTEVGTRVGVVLGSGVGVIRAVAVMPAKAVFTTSVRIALVSMVGAGVTLTVLQDASKKEKTIRQVNIFEMDFIVSPFYEKGMRWLEKVLQTTASLSHMIECRPVELG
jgi:hypothetical protein